MLQVFSEQIQTGQYLELEIDFGTLHRTVTDFVCHIIIGFESLIWHLHLYDASLAETVSRF